MDFLLDFEGQVSDLVVDGTSFTKHEALKTAVILSLFLRRGAWWGDALGTQGDAHGSRLHELALQPLDPERSPTEAEDIVREALAWALEDGVASEIGVDVEVVMPDRLNIDVLIQEPDGEAQRYAFVWDAARGA